VGTACVDVGPLTDELRHGVRVPHRRD
jgi:hypothetical protein